MSINAMTNAAVARRTDFPPAAGAPQGNQQIANAAGGARVQQNDVTAALAVITTYIPTEVLTVYIALLAVFPSATTPRSTIWKILIAFLVITPAAVWSVYAAKVKARTGRLPTTARELPIWEMLAGILAFAGWAVSLPDAPYLAYLALPSALGAVVIVTVSGLLGLLAPLFQLTIQA
jgi:hypothetical protein